jgi:hypothetical protein
MVTGVVNKKADNFMASDNVVLRFEAMKYLMSKILIIIIIIINIL